MINLANQREALIAEVEVFKKDTESRVDLASLMFEIKDRTDIENPNNVKAHSLHAGIVRQAMPLSENGSYPRSC